MNSFLREFQVETRMICEEEYFSNSSDDFAPTSITPQSKNECDDGDCDDTMSSRSTESSQDNCDDYSDTELPVESRLNTGREETTSSGSETDSQADSQGGVINYFKLYMVGQTSDDGWDELRETCELSVQQTIAEDEARQMGMEYTGEMFLGPTSVQVTRALLCTFGYNEYQLPTMWHYWATLNPGLATLIRRSIVDCRATDGRSFIVKDNPESSMPDCVFIVYHPNYSDGVVPLSKRRYGPNHNRAMSEVDTAFQASEHEAHEKNSEDEEEPREYTAKATDDEAHGQSSEGDEDSGQGTNDTLSTRSTSTAEDAHTMPK
ncbi:unnamed protein product [Clonostachys rosea]|uniref:Uncharacterized protein n=1 Tax=Bionectria ochroleuca TaxID=29856 RepID=A0ABY6UIS2_BIOOC|nr:unnamed protein product [Clonostachys rosea]